MSAHSLQTNRLARETSPYLLQHQHNPVDWYPWGNEAFAKAKAENKPIFLSIGYSTCHWCHVMERESFEDDATAAFLNAYFVSIKVDREERPDVDKIYMTAVQAMGQGGGWPLSAWLTPDRKPFYAGTYYPPRPMHGRPSFTQVLERIRSLWDEQRDGLLEAADRLTDSLNELVALPRGGREAGTEGVPGTEPLHQAAAAFASLFDTRHGGFGRAPKFPRPVSLRFLMRHAAREGSRAAGQMALETMRRMADGGIYDQLGGGFSRYSVDERWLVPHFEKMLYDNAQLMHAYVDGIQLIGPSPHDADAAEMRARFVETVRGTATYVLRDMKAPRGGFYSAEDADSEGREGAFYVWTLDQLRAVVSEREAELARRFWDVTAEGNFEDHSYPGEQPEGQNVVSRAMPLDQAARLAGWAPEEASAAWPDIQRRLFEAREQRIRPHRDDKVLTSWNGLMIGAMARAGAVLEERAWIEGACAAAQFLKDTQYEENRRLLRHSWREGSSSEAALLDDYAFLAEGLVHLFESTFDPAWLRWAIDLAEAMIERFVDREGGGFFMSAPGDESLLFRMKEDYDGAEPSGNSVAIGVLLRLGRLLDRQEFLKEADRTLAAFALPIQRAGVEVPNFLAELGARHARWGHIALAGTDVSELADVVRKRFMPDHALVHAGADELAAWLKPMAARGGPATAFVCEGFVCHQPVSEPSALAEMLDGMIHARR